MKAWKRIYGCVALLTMGLSAHSPAWAQVEDFYHSEELDNAAWAQDEASFIPADNDETFFTEWYLFCGKNSQSRHLCQLYYEYYCSPRRITDYDRALSCHLMYLTLHAFDNFKRVGDSFSNEPIRP